MMLFKIGRQTVLIALAVCGLGYLRAGAQPGGKTDSTHKAEKVRIRPYREVITPEAVSQKGLFTVHNVDDKVYFEIPCRLLGKDMMVINRLAAAAADMRMSARSTTGYAGDPVGGWVIRFERGPSHKLLVRSLSFTEYSRDSTQPMYAAVRRNNIEPIIATFPIAAFNPDSTALVVDMTDFLASDNDLFNFSDQTEKMIYHVGVQQNDKSYLEYVHVFPNNLEVRTVKTYAINGSLRTGNFTMELNSSLVLLPDTPMKSRYYDERVGYFTTDYTDFDANPQGVRRQMVVNHWRLEPKPEDIDKYKRGELVEPAKPIVFYIDRATPAKWVPYLIRGVEDWNVAFEKAGFKNAISARLAPSAEEDPTFSLDDARHSAIVYKPSTVPNASGPSICDPRSGEILESHINWYHNVMSLIHNWYMIQCGAVDPKARKMEFDDTLMGQLIRFVSSHEVGHALGLRHNFGSSSTVPVDSLRSKRWVEANGHTPSIMDYARFNYVAQPEDSISEAGLFPRIGDYDKWAIEWGYRWYDTRTPDDDKPVLNQLTIERLKNKRLWFGTEVAPADPRCQNEDLGDDAMKAGEYGIRNLQRILPQLASWTATPNEGYENLAALYSVLNNQFDRYLVHAMKNIAGVYATPKTEEQPGPVYQLVPIQRQKDALAFLDRNIFTPPLWLNDQQILDKTGQNIVSIIMDKQGGVISSLLGTYRLSRIISAEAAYGASSVYSLDAYLDDLDHMIFRELATGKPIDLYRRNLQKIYVDRLLTIAFPPASFGAMRGNDASVEPGTVDSGDMLPATYTDISSAIKDRLRLELAALKTAPARFTDRDSKAHLRDLAERIEKAFRADK